jgi:hypothetical protein
MSLADEDEPGGLKGVFGILSMTEDPPAHPQHHGAVPPKERFKRRRLPLEDKGLQKLAVR